MPIFKQIKNQSLKVLNIENLKFGACMFLMLVICELLVSLL